MKARTLEERAEFFINELPSNHNLTLGQVMAGFARAHAKAKLEEAAERATLMVESYYESEFRALGNTLHEANHGDRVIVNKKSITETPLD